MTLTCPNGCGNALAVGWSRLMVCPTDAGMKFWAGIDLEGCSMHPLWIAQWGGWRPRPAPGGELQRYAPLEGQVRLYRQQGVGVLQTRVKEKGKKGYTTIAGPPGMTDPATLRAFEQLAERALQGAQSPSPSPSPSPVSSLEDIPLAMYRQRLQTLVEKTCGDELSMADYAQVALLREELETAQTAVDDLLATALTMFNLNPEQGDGQ